MMTVRGLPVESARNAMSGTAMTAANCMHDSTSPICVDPSPLTCCSHTGSSGVRMPMYAKKPL